MTSPKAERAQRTGSSEGWLRYAHHPAADRDIVPHNQSTPEPRDRRTGSWLVTRAIGKNGSLVATGGERRPVRRGATARPRGHGQRKDTGGDDVVARTEDSSFAKRNTANEIGR